MMIRDDMLGAFRQNMAMMLQFPRDFSRIRLALTATIILSLGSGCDSSESGTTYSLYFLGGQSNMDGYGFVSQLPAELRGPVAGVRMFHGSPAPDDSSGGGVGVWTELQPGHGVGFSSDGVTDSYSDRFGVELSFARRVRELEPRIAVAIIKYSRGGTSIDTAAADRYGSWDPAYGAGEGINQYDHFLATVRNAFATPDIDGDGAADTLVPAGIIWMQGEADAAVTEEIAQRYQDNLTVLMDSIRSVFDAPDLPVVIGRISDSGQDTDGMVWDYLNVVRAAQSSFVAMDGSAALVTSTDGYAYSDSWHYDTEGYIDLGRKFAEAVTALHRQE